MIRRKMMATQWTASAGWHELTPKPNTLQISALRYLLCCVYSFVLNVELNEKAQAAILAKTYNNMATKLLQE